MRMSFFLFIVFTRALKKGLYRLILRCLFNMSSDSDQDDYGPGPSIPRTGRAQLPTVEFNESEFDSDKSDINWTSGSENESESRPPALSE